MNQRLWVVLFFHAIGLSLDRSVRGARLNSLEDMCQKNVLVLDKSKQDLEAGRTSKIAQEKQAKSKEDDLVLKENKTDNSTESKDKGGVERNQDFSTKVKLDDSEKETRMTAIKETDSSKKNASLGGEGEETPAEISSSKEVMQGTIENTANPSSPDELTSARDSKESISTSNKIYLIFLPIALFALGLSLLKVQGVDIFNSFKFDQAPFS